MCRLVCHHFALQRGSRAKRQQTLAGVALFKPTVDLGQIIGGQLPRCRTQAQHIEDIRIASGNKIATRHKGTALCLQYIDDVTHTEFIADLGCLSDHLT